MDEDMKTDKRQENRHWSLNDWLRNRYRLAYLETHGCMTVVEENYICYAFTKYDAWLSFVKNVGVSGHYTSQENLSSFTKTLKDIHRIPRIETSIDDNVKFERIQEKNIFGIDLNCCPLLQW